MVQVAIIGSGNIAHTRHIPNILRSSRAELRGIYNRNAVQSKQDAEKLGCKAYCNLEDMWDDPELDAVIICTPASTHCDLILAALAAGKHVLCEKPMCVTMEEADEILAAAEKSSKKLMISHNQRYYKPHQKAKELISSGVIGKVLNVRSSLGLNLPPINHISCDNDAGREVLCHRIDLMHYLLDANAEGVFARMTRVDETQTCYHVFQWDDTAMAIIQYENGVMVNFTASKVSHNGNDRMTQIFGTKGSITLYGQKAPVCVELESGETQWYDLTDVPSQREVEKTEVDEAFFMCVEENLPIPITARDGYKVVQILSALYRANEQEQFVYIR